MAEKLKGTTVSRSLIEDLSARMGKLSQQSIVPKLAFIRVGERPEDLTYQKMVTKRCAKLGIQTELHAFAEDASQEDIAQAIEEINHDDTVSGCLMFRPLPKRFDEEALIKLLDPKKDMDGITPTSLYGVVTGQQVGFSPCTAEGVTTLLDYYHVPICGARVVVVGRSLVIGKPVANLLLSRDATVTICHSRTRDLNALTRQADILIVATGHPKMIGTAGLATSQVVIDVGMNWDEQTKRFVGDVDEEAAEQIVKAYTPVPGGVGATTTAILMKHVVEAAERGIA